MSNLNKSLFAVFLTFMSLGAFTPQLVDRFESDSDVIYLKDVLDPIQVGYMGKFSKSPIMRIGSTPVIRELDKRAFCKNWMKPKAYSLGIMVDCDLEGKVEIQRAGELMSYEEITQVLDEKLSPRATEDSVTWSLSPKNKGIWLQAKGDSLNWKGLEKLRWGYSQNILLEVFHNNKLVRKERFQLRTKKWVKAPQLIKSKLRNEFIEKEDYRWIYKESKRVLRTISPDQKLVGLRLKRTMSKGSIVKPHDIEIPYSVEVGQTVSIYHKKYGNGIVVEGSALENGRVGDKIRVKNLSSGKRVVAKIDNRGRVWVQ